jgi:hypothetical protein
MKQFAVIVALLLVMLSACRSESDSARALPADEEILAKAYDTVKRVPDDFLVDERANTAGSYTIYHVMASSASYELCSDDYAEAIAWENADNETRSTVGELVGSSENARYFEFIRDLTYPDDIGNIPDLTTPGFSRVFKCNYVNRSGVDRTNRNGFAGTLNVRPNSAETLKELVEYLWQFTFFWPATKTVLESYSSDTGDYFRHTLLLAFVSRQGLDQCDLVDVVEWVFDADKSSGELRKDFNVLYRLEAKRIGGVPQKCES